MIVFSYWEGPIPEHIQTCLSSMRQVCGSDLVLVHPETAEYWTQQSLHPGWRQLSQPALRADAIRAALLAVHGGWWWDADTIAYRMPYDLHTLHPGKAMYMTWTKRPRRVLNGYIYFPVGHPTARRWLERINQSLDRDPGTIDWCDLGERLLTSELTRNSEAVEIPRRLFLPIDIDSSVELFFRRCRKPRSFVRRDTVCFGLNHSYFMYRHGPEMARPREEWPRSPLLIHQLLAGATT